MLSALIGCFAIFGCLLLLGWLMVIQVHPFLSVNAPIQADVLVIEGWLPDYALEEVVSEFNRGVYQKIIIVGSPLRHGYFLSDYKNFAYLAAATLTFLGIDPEKIVPLPMPHTQRDRTKTAAFVLKDWLLTHGQEIQAVNLYGLGAHARRSWLAFKQVLKPEIQVGIMTGIPQEYEPDRWWQYSAGVRSVLSEIIAYGYACLSKFSPPLELIEAINLEEEI